MSKDEKDLRDKFVNEMVHKRCANMHEDFEASTNHVIKWKKENPKDFDFLYNIWYRETILKQKH